MSVGHCSIVRSTLAEVVLQRDRPHGFGLTAKVSAKARLRLSIREKRSNQEPKQTKDLAGSFVFAGRK